MSSQNHHATLEGTTRFRDRAVGTRKLPSQHFRVGPDGLVLSSLGLGTYIGPPDATTDLAVEHAVTVCLTSGRVNIVDTAINYRYQRAERSIGRSLSRLFSRDEVQRDEVFVATKNGYFAPDAESPTPPDQWVQEELIRTGILDPTDGRPGSGVRPPTGLTCPAASRPAGSLRSSEPALRHQGGRRETE